MNVFTRLGLWWDDKNVKESHFEQWCRRLEVLEKSSQVPPQIAKDIAILKQQMDQIQLYIGLKREPQATHVQGGPKIS